KGCRDRVPCSSGPRARPGYSRGQPHGALAADERAVSCTDVYGGSLMESVLVTGASRGIGAGIASRLAGKGFNLVLWARTGSDLDAVASECRSHGVTVSTAAVDVSDPDSVASAGAAALDGVDALRGCVINAGAATFGKLSDFSTDEWRAVIGT